MNHVVICHRFCRNPSPAAADFAFHSEFADHERKPSRRCRTGRRREKPDRLDWVRRLRWVRVRAGELQNGSSMLLTIESSASPATDLGFLLHKNPDHVHEKELSFGWARVCYLEATEERCTAALIVDIDPVQLVRGHRGGPQGNSFSLSQYVNDRPYAVSSFMSVAINKLFGTAMTGRSRTSEGGLGRSGGGFDVSWRSLEVAGRRLRLDEMPPRRRARVDLWQGALTYREKEPET